MDRSGDLLGGTARKVQSLTGEEGADYWIFTAKMTTAD